MVDPGAPHPPFAGLILAGGEGTRWGCPKARARLADGDTFLERCASVLTQAGAAPIVATLPPGAAIQAVPGVEAVGLHRSGLDMFASLKAGMARLLEAGAWHAVIVLPVDHPLVAAATITALVAAGPPAAVPSLNGRHGHPVCLWRKVAETLPCSTVSDLRQLLASCGARDVAVTDPGVRRNLNSPADLAEPGSRTPDPG